ncbi:MAG: 50S ribosomal protein L25 [Candidatus Margulisbacteria bacterium]|nr:50S ribosomal protein L25 [Candidatus Margulisiibacteriota bacterium]
MQAVKIEVQKRTEFGKEKVNKLRNQNFIPVELYGTDLKENVSLKVDYKTISQHLLTGVLGKNTIFSFDLDGKTIYAITYEAQVHPISKKILHLDFKTVNETNKVKVKLLVKAVGNPIGVQKGGRLQQKVDVLQLMLLPQEIVPHVDVNVANLDAKEQLVIGDLVLPPSAEVLKFSASQQVFFIKV